MTTNAAGTTVVVLAGGRNSQEMAAATGTENRALTPIGARTMLDYVVSALSEAPSAGQVFVVGNVPQSRRYTQIAGRETLLENLLAGLDAAGEVERVLVSTSDIPFLTADAVEDFLSRAAATGAALCCSYVPLSLCLRKYPVMKRTAVRLSEGRFTLGNLMLVQPAFLRTRQEEISKAYASRKSPVQVARLLGFGLLLRLLGAQLIAPGLLSVAALEAAVSRVLGGRAAGICSAYAEIGTDVDKPEDVAVARRLLAS